jgi:hypothetical protein
MDAALKMPPPGFDELSPGDQLEYLFALWGRMLALNQALPVPDWHRQVIGERLAEYRSGKAGLGRDWSEARKDLRARLAKVR